MWLQKGNRKDPCGAGTALHLDCYQCQYLVVTLYYSFCKMLPLMETE